MKPKISFANTGNSYAIKAPMINSITPTPIRSNTVLTRSKVTPLIIPGTTSVTKRHTGPSLIAENQRKTLSSAISTSYASPYLQQKITTFDTSAIKPAPYLVTGPVYTKVNNASPPVVPITYSTGPAYQLQYVQQYQQQTRPAYQRLQNRKPQSRKQAPLYEQPAKPSSCCCLPLWILLGLLGLAGLVLGLLYGLGILGKGNNNNTNTNTNTNVPSRNPEGIYINPVPIQTVSTIDTDFKIPPPIFGKIVPQPTSASTSAYSNTGYQSNQNQQSVNINGQYTTPSQANSQIITSASTTTQPIIVSPTNQISSVATTTANVLSSNHKLQKIHHSQISRLHDY